MENDKKNEVTTKPLRNLGALGNTSDQTVAKSLRIYHPDDPKVFLEMGDGKPVIIELFGNESDEFTAANHENRRILNARALTAEPFDPQVEDDSHYRVQSYCTKTWHNIPTGWFDGTGSLEPLAFDQTTAFVLYKRLPWLRRQVQLGIWDRKSSNFEPAL